MNGRSQRFQLIRGASEANGYSKEPYNADRFYFRAGNCGCASCWGHCPHDLSEKKRPSNTIEINVPMPEFNTNVSVTSDTGIEKRRPTAGKSNLQGKVLFNEEPVAGIEVRLCGETSA